MRALLLAIVCAWVAVSAQAAGTLRRGNHFEPSSLDPHKISTVYERFIVQDLFEGLTEPGPDEQPRPGVAQSWTVSADGKTWTFILRPGLKWSDGAPITVDDVVFSFRRFLDPKTAGELASTMYAIKNARLVNTGKLPVEQLGVAAPKSDTIVFTLEYPAPYLAALLANGTSSIVPKHVIAKFGDDWIKPGNAVSNGAFVLKAWIPNGGITLVRNPNYREPPSLDSVVYEPTEDLDAALTRFKAGGLDIQFEFPSNQTDILKRDMPTQTKVVPGQLTYYLPLNLKNPKLKDVRVRRALSLAVDRAVLVSKVTRSGELTADTYVPPSLPGYTPVAIPDFPPTMPERLAKARALLTEAGVTPATPLRLTYTHGNTSDRKRIAVAIAAMWKPLGVIVSLEGLEGKVMFGNLREGNFEAAYVGWQADYPDAASFLTPLLSTNVVGNYSRYDNPTYDALINKAAATADSATRLALMREAELMMIQDQPMIPLYTGVNRELVSPRVHGWQPNPSAIHLSRFLSVDPGSPTPR
jgi:oligopeptide transport system substrate-binding protein